MIKVQSLIQDKRGLHPVEVELALWPGLPGIQFLGLPDQHLKESALRIKSAIKSSGFQFPVAQQILVNLRPSHLKKTSRGLELAVAAAYLWDSGQIKAPMESQDFFIYGELSLSGDVLEPEDLPSHFHWPHGIVLTGFSKAQQKAPFRRQLISRLTELAKPREVFASVAAESLRRPWDLVQRNFSSAQARLLEILAVGGHSALLAGPAGSGKSTVAQCLPGFLREPAPEEFFELQKIHREFGAQLKWRPVIKPHHSTPLKAMVGGGSIPFAGEISRAHGGVLILDELLEFSVAVQESLREPFEEGKMRVFRNGVLREYPARAQILATTNLCPCGKWTPLQADAKYCSLSRQRCRSHTNRLSGPLLDRFEILEFTTEIGKLEINGMDLFEKVQKAQNFKVERSESGGVNADLLKYAQEDEQISQRRKMALLRLARTLADLDFSPKVKRSHLDEAVVLTQVNFTRISKWG